MGGHGMVSRPAPLALASRPCGAYYPLAGSKPTVDVPRKTNNPHDISIVQAQSKQ